MSALSGRNTPGGYTEKALISNFEILNLVPTKNKLKTQPEPPQTDAVNNPPPIMPPKTTSPEGTKWRRVGLVLGRKVHLDTIVWCVAWCQCYFLLAVFYSLFTCRVLVLRAFSVLLKKLNDPKFTLFPQKSARPCQQHLLIAGACNLKIYGTLPWKAFLKLLKKLRCLNFS